MAEISKETTIVQGPMGYVHPLTPSEIRIEIVPRGQVEYYGTWDHLITEGVLTEEARRRGVNGQRVEYPWTEGIFWYWLRRSRPLGAKSKDCPGPIDYWSFYVRLAGHEGTGFAAANEYFLEQELKRARFNVSPAGRLQDRLYWRAYADKKFQALLLQVGAKKPRKVGGRPRSTEAASK